MRIDNTAVFPAAAKIACVAAAISACAACAIVRTVTTACRVIAAAAICAARIARTAVVTAIARIAMVIVSVPTPAILVGHTGSTAAVIASTDVRTVPRIKGIIPVSGTGRHRIECCIGIAVPGIIITPGVS